MASEEPNDPDGVGQSDAPDQAGDHYVTDENYEELLALSNCEGCEKDKNYHPCDSKKTPEDRAKCKEYEKATGKSGKSKYNPPPKSFHPPKEPQNSKDSKPVETYYAAPPPQEQIDDDSSLATSEQEEVENVSPEQPLEANELNEVAEPSPSENVDEELEENKPPSGPSSEVESAPASARNSGPKSNPSSVRSSQSKSTPASARNSEVKSNPSSVRNSEAKSTPSSAKSSQPNSERSSLAIGSSHRHVRMSELDEESKKQSLTGPQGSFHVPPSERNKKSSHFYALNPQSKIDVDLLDKISRNSSRVQSKKSLASHSKQSHSSISKSKSKSVTKSKSVIKSKSVVSQSSSKAKSRSANIGSASKQASEATAHSESLPSSRPPSESDLVHHHIFEHEESETNIIAREQLRSTDPEQIKDSRRASAITNAKEAPPNPPSAADNEPPSDSQDEIPSDAPSEERDSSYESLVALANCVDCQWNKNYHPCYEKDGAAVGQLAEQCAKMQLEDGYYEDDDKIIEEEKELPLPVHSCYSILINRAMAREEVPVMPKGDVEKGGKLKELEKTSTASPEVVAEVKETEPMSEMDKEPEIYDEVSEEPAENSDSVANELLEKVEAATEPPVNNAVVETSSDAEEKPELNPEEIISDKKPELETGETLPENEAIELPSESEDPCLIETAEPKAESEEPILKDEVDEPEQSIDSAEPNVDIETNEHTSEPVIDNVAVDQVPESDESSVNNSETVEPASPPNPADDKKLVVLKEEEEDVEIMVFVSRQTYKDLLANGKILRQVDE